jgi:hypothetical protein
MTDSELAQELINRFNKLILNEEVKSDINKLFNVYIDVKKATLDSNLVVNADDKLCCLGLINGLIGDVKVVACYDDNMNLIEFKTTDDDLTKYLTKPE